MPTEAELIPFQPETHPLHGGHTERRADGSYYFGGVNHGEGLSKWHLDLVSWTLAEE